MARKKEDKPKIALKDLQAAGKAMNAIFTSGDQIKTVGVKSEKLQNEIIEAAAGLDPEQDELEDGVVQTLIALGCNMAGFIEDNVDNEELEDETPENAEQEDFDEDQEQNADEDESPDEGDPDEGEDYSLKDAAEELNTLLDFAEADKIPTDAKKDKLEGEIIDACGSIQSGEFAQSEFSSGLLAVLDELGVDIEFKPEKGAKKAKTKPAEKTKPAAKVKEKSAAKAKTGPTRKVGEKTNTLPTIEKFIAEGKHTRKEIVEKVIAELPHLSESTIKTAISDGKNEKYNKFKKLVKISDNGIVSF